MKLQEIDNQEIIIGGGKERTFSIDDSNPVIFDILRNKMYSNKIGAICREVASNSRDANREAGRGDVPIEIEFTATQNIYNIGDTCIIFRDFGIGITPDRMDDVFMKYAASTKRSSNAQTGGFGLGAKTPFAYTDSFIIKTVCNWAKPIMGIQLVERVIDKELHDSYIEQGIEFEVTEEKDGYFMVLIEEETITDYEDEKKWKFTYNAIIDRTGKGKMITLDEVEASDDDKTGTEIIVPITSNQDKTTFEKECYRSTMFWGNVNYINFLSSQPEINYLYEEEGFRVVAANTNVFGYNVPYIGLIDGIPYEINPSKSPSGLGSEFHILLDIDLDKVIINANRESIQEDEGTIEYLDGIVEKVTDFLIEQVDDYLFNHVDFKDALRKYGSIHGKSNFRLQNLTDLEELIRGCIDGYSGRLLKEHDFSIVYDEKKVTGRLGLKYHNIFKVSKNSVEKDVDGKFIKCSFEYKKLDTVGSHLIDAELYYLDKGRYSTVKNLKLLEEAKFYLMIKPVAKIEKEKIQEDLDLLATLKLGEKNYSEIVTDKKKIEYAKKEAKVVTMPVRDEDSYWYSDKLKFSYETKELTKYGKVIDKDEVLFHPMDSVRDANRFRSYTLEGEQWKLMEQIGKAKKVYIINRTNYEKHLKPHGYKTVNQKFKAMKKTYLAKLQDYSKIKSIFEDCLPEFLVDNFMEILPKSTADLYDKKKSLDKMKIKKSLSNISWRKLGVEPSKFDFDGFEKSFYKKMKDKYPMLMPYLNTLSKATTRKEHNNSEPYIKAKKIVEDYLKCIN